MSAKKTRKSRKPLPGILGWSTETRQKEAKKAWKGFDKATRARLIAVLRRNAKNRAREAAQARKSA